MLRSSSPAARTVWLSLMCVALALCAPAVVQAAAQQAIAAQAVAAPAGAAQAAAAQSAPTQDGAGVFPDTGQITQFLDLAVSWYRQLAVERQIATEASDLMMVSDNRQTADQIIRLAFEFARAAASLITTPRGSGAQGVGGSSEPQWLPQMLVRLDRQYQATQSELDGDRQALSGASGRRRQTLQSQISELQGELELADARRDAVRSMAEFARGASGAGTGAGGLRARIEALADSVAPTSVTSAAAGSASAAATINNALAASTSARELQSTNIWDLTAQAFELSAKVRRVEALTHQTLELSRAAAIIRAPLVADLTALSAQGDQLASQADNASQSQLALERAQLDALAAQFKRISAAAVPLGKQAVLIDLYQRNLVSWRDTIELQYASGLRALGVRAGILILVLLLVIGATELWKRAVYRFVHEPRRRYQFLLIRRFVLWILIALIIAFALASRLDSFVTFAGLLTAGVAVALQSVILSVVGYFFLIGKYGIRVGDRVQIGDVAGEVIDIGLVRLHLMEFAGGVASGPTGRIVAFSNSIVFQSSGSLFRQMPGISFEWHDITLTLAPAADYGTIKERLLQAAQLVLDDYKDELERQSREIERTAISRSGHGLQPQVHLRFAPACTYATIRYPVDLQHAAEIDERISQQLLRAVEREPRLKLADPGPPDLTQRTDP